MIPFLHNPSRDWFYHRFTAIFLIIWFLSFFIDILDQIKNWDIFVINCNSLFLFFLNIPFNWTFFLFFLILNFHIFHGIHNLVCDYINHDFSRLFSLFLLSIIQIESLKFFYIFLFF